MNKYIYTKSKETLNNGAGGGGDGAGGGGDGTSRRRWRRGWRGAGGVGDGACESLDPSALAILARPQLSVYKRK